MNPTYNNGRNNKQNWTAEQVLPLWEHFCYVEQKPSAAKIQQLVVEMGLKGQAPPSSARSVKVWFDNCRQRLVIPGVLKNNADAQFAFAVFCKSAAGERLIARKASRQSAPMPEPEPLLNPVHISLFGDHAEYPEYGDLEPEPLSNPAHISLFGNHNDGNGEYSVESIPEQIPVNPSNYFLHSDSANKMDLDHSLEIDGITPTPTPSPTQIERMNAEEMAEFMTFM